MSDDSDDGLSPNPVLTDEENKAQRGDDPANVHHPPGEGKEPTFHSDKERRDQISKTLEATIRERKPKRQDSFWPYLLIRAFLGDHGVRQPPLGVFWESPDILIVPGIVDTIEGNTPTLNPKPGVDHTVFVRVWNLGRFPAIGVKLRVYWANPSFSFNDPNSPELPHYIGGTYLNLGDRYQPNSHQLFKIPAPWRPVVENQGHECMLAKVDAFSDRAADGFNANVDRHVAQRNLILAPPGEDLTPLLNRLSVILPDKANLHVVHGMANVEPILLTHSPAMVRRINVPTNLSRLASPLNDNTAHIGAVIKGRDSTFFVPGAVMSNISGKSLQRENDLADRRDLVDLKGSRSIAAALSTSLDLADLKASTIAAKLGNPNDGHLLRFQAVRDGQVIGGYSIIVHG